MKHMQAPAVWRRERRHSRLTRFSALLGTAALALTGAAATTAVAEETPTSVALVGSLQNELGCEADWAPACTSTAMTDPDGDGVYSYTATIPAGSYEIKVALNGTWDLSYGKNGAAGGDNIPLTLAGPAKLTFTWNKTNHRLGVRAAELTGAYTAADAALAAAPIRQGMGEHFYFVLTDRFANGDPSNDKGGLTGDASVTGFDPSNEGYYHGGDLRGLLSKLDYIQSLGTTAVWLTPSFTNQPVQGEGANQSAGYHGYWITDFTSIDPHLGGNAALAELRDALHARGMRLYLDIVTNHTADLIDYQEKTYTYVDTATKPYKDAAGKPVDISAVANTDAFPTLDAATSFPYTPVRRGKVIPEALNDVTLYHNRGDSTWAGESVTMGDFVGLDDLMTENPKVEKTFEEVYKTWMDFGVDGFRIDTAKHVNFEFWQKWTAAIDAHAASTNPNFFTFGEVYDADATKTSPYPRRTGMDATLDFAFQASALGFAKGRATNNLSKLFNSDDYYTTTHSSVHGQPTFLGNHDMGRIGYLLAGGTGSAETLQRDQLAHSLMYLTRGQPVVYYGDEQGFAGTGGDKAARQDMFPTQVGAYANQPLVDGGTAGAGEHYSTTTPLYQHIAGLAKLRAEHKALASGSQVELYAHDDAGLYAFARVDRTEKIEHLVALNNATADATATFNTLTPGATYTALYGTPKTVTADAAGSVTLTVPALSAVVLKADRQVASGSPEVAFTTQAGANLFGPTAEITATTTAHRWAETTFSYRPVGTTEWTTVGTAEDDTPRVFADVSALPAGTVLELRAVTTDAAGNKAAVSTTAVVGADLTGEVPPPPPAGPIDGLEVTLPGTHNTEMGCPTDWAPDCKQARLTQDPQTKLYRGTFEIPAGEWDYKVAIGGSWDENYGANGVAGGDNIRYESKGGKITFVYDARTHLVWIEAAGDQPEPQPSATAATAEPSPQETPLEPKPSQSPELKPTPSSEATAEATATPLAPATALATPGQKPQRPQGLSVTGANVVGLLTVAGGLVVAGMLLARRRRA
ncbi:Alpha-amylase precursor [Actinomyces bovis]|uniref:Alpha-amylase n=1 Tax=Actinomyces bovis TaxID=1658 RepID=A0ABY1VP66_9ACTO|nr:alpha-amylase family glycosyl hydrolase [Actinomyces bovis]SPT53709.1 Alpha-amylase precursor [Actinomyces bovis]VEG55849.1 Alpha-amylase precursor [Actinomyces israelii]